MTIRVGIIGTGYFGMFHANILTDLVGVKLISILGTNLKKAEQMASSFTDVKAYDELTDMLDATNLDAVYICVPPMAHGEIEFELIKRGIPFLVEKPLGNNIEIPTIISNEIKKKSLITSVGYHYRYSESITKLKELIHSEKVGIVLGQYMGAMPQVQWWRNQSSSGGQFIEQTTHIVDLLRYICGEVNEVYSVFGNEVLSAKDDSITVADVGTVTMKLRSGVVANITNTCILPESVGKLGLTLYTDQGIFEWSPGKLIVTKKDSTSEFVDTLNPYQKESEAFIHAVRTGDTSRILSNYEDSLLTHQVTFAALKSSSEKSVIRI